MEQLTREQAKKLANTRTTRAVITSYSKETVFYYESHIRIIDFSSKPVEHNWQIQIYRTMPRTRFFFLLAYVKNLEAVVAKEIRLEKIQHALLRRRPDKLLVFQEELKRLGP